MTTESTPTADELAELVSYLPILRRLASYEKYAEASIPDLLHTLDAALNQAAQAFCEARTAGTDGSTAPPGLQRPVDEPLHDNARLIWPQVKWLDKAVEDGTEDFAVIKARAKAEVGDPQ